jgi:EpsI family protein
VNQLVTFAAMALPVGYLFLRGIWRRVALVGVALAVAYLSNGTRIALVGWLAYHGLGDGSLGAMHLTEGLAVSLVGYAVIGAFLAAFMREGKNPSRQSRAPARPGAGARMHPGVRRGWLDWSLVAALAMAAGFELFFHVSDARLPRPLDSLPQVIGGWSAEPFSAIATRFPALDDDLVQAYPTPSGERRFDGADAELVRSYRSRSGLEAQIYVGYYRQQRDGKELTGDASQALNRVASPVTLDVASGGVEVNQVERRAGPASRSLLFWYDINGRIVRSIYAAKGYTLWDALTHGRTNGAVVMVAWTCPPGGSCDADRQQVLGFVQAALPLVRARLLS